jgi:damage-control phosphatase, subfamily III
MACDLLGPLAHAFPLLSLRTNKADVAVGIPQSVADALDARGEKWRVNGRYVASDHRSRSYRKKK